jgi:hypothetical protein
MKYFLMIPTGAIDIEFINAGLFFCACIIDAQKDKKNKGKQFSDHRAIIL